MFAPDTAFVEIEEHLPDICPKRGFPTDKAMAVYDAVTTIVQELPGPSIAVERLKLAHALSDVSRTIGQSSPVH